MARGSRRFRWFLAVAILAIILLVTNRFWLALMGGYLVKADAPAPADVVVVLAGDFSGNRITMAGDMVRQGLAPKALISGAPEIYGLHECDLAIPFAARHGYPESYFVPLPNEGRSTVTEADAVIAELRRLHAHRVDIVTSNFHTRRAGGIYRSKAPDLELRVVSAPDEHFTPDGWWKNRDARKTFVLEWSKTVAGWFGI